MSQQGSDGQKSPDEASHGKGAGDGADRGGGEVKTAQPFSEAPTEPYADMGGGSPNKPRPDQAGDPAAQAESAKTTQRQE